ncbi:transposase [Pseudorhodoferax sp.]|uniref:transposase n=1 Tax=Pseudorhodoferax sp. TaxID=1993553 RepID=UPI0039E4C0D9
MDRFDAQALAYCQMGNHYHLVLHTRQANLSRLMRHVNGVYTQAFNRRHGLVGHLLQGRFKAILVDTDTYLLALCRYVERNPVAAGLVQQACDWPWSSCRAHIGLAPTPPWLDSDGLHGHLLGRPVATPKDRALATEHYARLVVQARHDDAGFWERAVHGQVFLGDEDFAQRMRARAEPPRLGSAETPQVQRQAQRPVDWATLLAQSQGHRNRALVLGYRQHGMTMSALAAQAGLSVSMVSRIVAAAERKP